MKSKENYLIYQLLFKMKNITLAGCSRGVYGESCNKTCPDNCIEHKCDIISGTCLECLPGWVGDFCDRGSQNILYKILMNFQSMNVHFI